MSNKTDLTMNINSTLNLIGWIWGMIFIAIGVINIFWGNDQYFGILIVLLSLMFLPPFNAVFTELTGRTIPRVIKIAIAIFIAWAALGVGEIVAKVDMMLESFS
jgi:hypothetical protein